MAENARIVLHNDETGLLAQKLTDGFPGVDVRECNSYAGLPGVLADFRPDIIYTVRFAGTPGYPKDVLFAPDGPRWIANGGAGTDHFGVWDPAKVTVTNAAGVAADMMAEYVLGSFLHFTLDIPGLQADKSRRLWQARIVRPLKGKTLLIIGLGHTGQAIAALARAFGMQVIGTRARPEPMDNVDEVHGAEDLPALLPRADFIAVATPLTEQTRGLIGKAEIAAMKHGVILADVSRGTVVDQSALSAALVTGQIGAAALDVFEKEPLPQDSPFWEQDNVILSPHCSSVYEGWEEASFDLFLLNLGRWLKGEALVNVVDPGRGY